MILHLPRIVQRIPTHHTIEFATGDATNVKLPDCSLDIAFFEQRNRARWRCVEARSLRA